MFGNSRINTTKERTMKSREAVTTNGRAAFYAAMWEDMKNAAHDVGWDGKRLNSVHPVPVHSIPAEKLILWYAGFHISEGHAV